ncbi:MAG: S1/P1 nuclease [Myxococcota bacterium]
MKALLSRTALCVFAAALLPLPAIAWGNVGHELVAEIAARHLEAGARREVRALLGESMAAAATWADAVRNQRPDTRPWHYVNIPLDAATYDAARDCPEGACAIAAIERELAILRDRRRAKAARAEALRFVIHLVGDLHQPLHCAERNHDGGGNGVTVRWFGSDATLHHVWDADIIDQPRLSRAQIAARLSREIRAGGSALAADAGEGGLAAWAEQAHALAASNAYRIPASRRLAKAYFERNAPVVDRQLIRAGLRLANVLNAALTHSPERDG